LWWKKEKGQAMVEFVLILPVLLFILLGIMEFGRIYADYLVLNNAARAGARLAAVGATDGEITASILAKTKTLESANLLIAIEPAENERTRGISATIRLDYRLDLLSPIWDMILPNPFPIYSVVTMRVE